MLAGALYTCVHSWIANLCLPATDHLFGLDDFEIIGRNIGDESREDKTDYRQDTHFGYDEFIKFGGFFWFWTLLRRDVFYLAR